MRHRPLNSDTPFELWPHFDPGRWIDFNPSFVRLADGRAFAAIRRDRVPPVPGKGTVWAVAVDDAMQPAGVPFALIADGEDPRAVCIGPRVLVFYVHFERDPQQRITGTSMVLAEFDAQDSPWRPLAHFQLPKYPLGGAPAGSSPGWEKNWVPFVIGPTQVGLIYSHDPWQVIVLNVDAASSERRFEQAWKAPGLHWAQGGIRGGTPPVRHGEGELVTFFHSSQVIGSRKSYMAGACVIGDSPPYAPLRLTPEPLLVAPYRGGMHRHGWAVAASVIFPLGCEATADGYRLLCGIDDGEIGSFTIPRAALQQRLQPLPALPAADDLPLLRFLELAAPAGRTLLDIGSDAGMFVAGLAAGYRNVEAVASSGPAAAALLRQAAGLGLHNVNVHLPQDIAADGVTAACRGPWPLTSLDDAGFIELDLLTLQVSGTADVLRGLRHTLARDRPLLLLRARADGSERAAIDAVAAELGYETVTGFPRSPGALCLAHPSRRAEIAWFA